jgi:hypothetical protein
MTNFLLKSGMTLMLVAGVFIITAFFIFAFFSLILLAPGMLLYNAGIKNIYNSMINTGSGYDDEIKTIDVTSKSPDNEFVNKSKVLIKSVVKKIRNFLNKYVD